MKIIKQEVQAIADLKAGYTLGHADVAILNELARIALASLEAEASGRNPVLAYADSYRDMANQGVESIPVWSVITDLERNIAPLFTAPPAPVSVPDEATPENIEILASTYAPCGVTYQWDRDECNAAADSWNACHAAMLHGAVQPQNQQQNIPENIPVNTPCKEAPEHIWLQTAGVWPENGEFSELTWCSDNQHEDDTLYVRADVVTGNSPVIQDGWVLVPIEPTPDMRDAYHQAQEEYEETDGLWSPDHQWKAMLAAAPQPEVK